VTGTSALPTSVSAYQDSGGAGFHVEPRAFLGARVLLIATLLGAPLAFGAVQTWAWAAISISALLLLLLWAIGCVRQGVIRIAWSPLYVPAALFVLLGTAQLYGGLTLDAMGTRESLIKLVAYLIVFFLAGQLFAFASPRVWGALGLTVTLFAFALALFAILQFFSSGGSIYWTVKLRWGGYVFGPYINHNHYAGLMEMLIPIAAAFVLSSSESQSWRTLLRFSILVPVAALLLSGSRGGMIALLGEILILSAVVHKFSRTPGRKARATLVGVGIVAAALLFFWMDPGEVSQRLTTVAKLAQSPEATLGERTMVAIDSLRIWRDHPWLGTGLGSFETAYPRYRSFPGDAVYDHAHNDYAEALAETGLVGAGLMLGGLLLFLRLAFRQLAERLRNEVGWIQLGAALGCCGLLIHSLVDFNLHIPANAAWFAVSAAIATKVYTLGNRFPHGEAGQSNQLENRACPSPDTLRRA